MKTFALDIINKIRDQSKILDQKALLRQSHWVLVSEILTKKTTFIFRSQNKLLISEDGSVHYGSWEVIEKGILLLETRSGNFLVNQSFIDQNILALSLDGSDEYLLMVNGELFNSGIHTVHDLQQFILRTYFNSAIEEKKKVPKYFYTERYEEFGPYTLAAIKSGIRDGEINPFSFIRSENEINYSNRTRIRDLLRSDE